MKVFGLTFADLHLQVGGGSPLDPAAEEAVIPSRGAQVGTTEGENKELFLT